MDEAHALETAVIDYLLPMKYTMDTASSTTIDEAIMHKYCYDVDDVDGQSTHVAIVCRKK